MRPYEDREWCVRMLAEHGSVAAVARATGLTRQTIAPHFTRHGLRSSHPNTNTAPKSAVAPADVVELTSGTNPRGTDTTSAEALLRDHGLDPAEWDYTVAGNQWDALAGDGTVTTLHQFTVRATRKVTLDMIVPARLDGWKPPKRPKPRKTKEPKLVALFSDAHAPYQDRGLESCSLQWLEKHQPAEAWDLGDLMDLPVPSRHRVTRGFDASPQECIDERYGLDRRRVEASPGTRWRAVLGNHDERLEHAVVDRLGRAVARIGRALSDVPAWDLGYLLRYDELGIELIRPDGDYHSVTVEIVPGLFARHGTKAGKHGGAVKAIERRDTSLIQGHDHKLVSQVWTRYDARNEPRIVQSLSVGAMCQRDLGYVEDPDTAQGFTTITLHSSGRWIAEHAVYDAASKSLAWRDELFVG